MKTAQKLSRNSLLLSGLSNTISKYSIIEVEVLLYFRHAYYFFFFSAIVMLFLTDCSDLTGVHFQISSVKENKGLHSGGRGGVPRWSSVFLVSFPLNAPCWNSKARLSKLRRSEYFVNIFT